MSDAILVLNSGSSSIKFALFTPAEPLQRKAHGSIDGIGGVGRLRAYGAQAESLADRTLEAAAPLDHERALAVLLDWGQALGITRDLSVVGHRVVHGGTHYSAPVRIDGGVMAGLTDLIPLAPLHQPHNLAGIRALAALRPRLLQVACFDTAFHSTQAPHVQRYALPRAFAEQGVRRYGFHGLSYEYIATRLGDVAGAGAHGKVVVAHLGNGASLCAMQAGHSRDSTMGFTALDGLPMGTRCGALDPGVVLYLLGERGMSLPEVTDLLYRRSGLLGVSGISNDMRVLLADERAAAREAIDLYVYRVARELGGMAAALGGLDMLVFTGGIGENATPIRARICAQAAWLGVRLDAAANAAGGPRISHADSRVPVYVIATDEELMIARHTARLLASPEHAGRLP